ncbi:putative leucine-rich repeat domain, L domain-containing protein [Medicago truncatula]|uniref:Putative leucine-rich repeat domain, L domain-containing protein n=1 Tax=Medicago truncatula TaxID=3880 RepID=A0A396IMI9_MEDTR|nr:putative leucine-rich repeat domain, L domain-containing protein [Medicago truncatula]
MNDLVELQLQFISQLRCLIDTKHIASQVPNVFSMLVVLDLWRLENLKELFNGPLSFDSLNSLEKLSIKDCKHLQSLFKCNLNLFNLKSVSLEKCPMLMSLFHLSTAVSLVLLERLEIEDCGCLEYIIDERKGEESRGEIVDDNDNTSHGAMLQNLKVLNIKNCPRIELILAFHSAHDLPALESITIEHCDKVKYIFDQDLKLGSLKQFKLHGIPNLIDIFPECNRTMSFAIKEASSISGYASQPQEKSDPIKCNIFSWTNVYCWGKKNGHKLRSTTSNQFQVPDNLMVTLSPSLLSSSSSMLFFTLF